MKRGLRKGNRTTQMMLAPYSLWSVIFIVVPLLFIAYYAFTDNNFNFTLENITRFFTATSQVTADDGTVTEVRTYLMIFMRSLKLAVISTIICLGMGYPLAYIMARAEEKTQRIMMTLIMIPMWMNFLIRTYAWMTILQDTGIFNSVLGVFGIDPVHIIGTEGAVIIGMANLLHYGKDGYPPYRSSTRPWLQQHCYSAPCNLPAQPSGCYERHHNGAYPIHQYLLYFTETG